LKSVIAPDLSKPNYSDLIEISSPIKPHNKLLPMLSQKNIETTDEAKFNKLMEQMMKKYWYKPVKLFPKEYCFQTVAQIPKYERRHVVF
jgi:hypothetical protein